MSTSASIKNTARRASASREFVIATRLGFAARGLIYIIMGYLSFRVATGKGGQFGTPQTALQTLAGHSFGHTLLWIMTIGLLFYGIWNIIRALGGSEFATVGSRSGLARIGYFINGLVYVFLAWSAYSIANGKAASSSSGSLSKLMGMIMSKPWGMWLVALIGIIVIIVGIGIIIKGLSRNFQRQFHAYQLTNTEERIITDLGRFGTVAQGIVLALIGLLIFFAAYHANPGQPIGLDTALANVLTKPYGPGLVIIVALGFIAFGIYSIMCAIWFRNRNTAY